MSLFMFTNLYGYCITTNRNLASEVILFVLLVVHEDMKNPHNATSDPEEHEFGCFWMNIR